MAIGARVDEGSASGLVEHADSWGQGPRAQAATRARVYVEE